MEINEKLLRQIIEDVLSEMQTRAISPFHFAHLVVGSCLFSVQIPKIF